MVSKRSVTLQCIFLGDKSWDVDVPRDSLEAVTITTKVGSIDDIVQHFWVGIENRVYKTNWTLTSDGALLVNL